MLPVPAYAREPIWRLARPGCCDGATMRMPQFYGLVLRVCRASRVERPAAVGCPLQSLPEIARSTNVGNCPNLLGKNGNRDFMLRADYR
jgi:hypothetical protein